MHFITCNICTLAIDTIVLPLKTIKPIFNFRLFKCVNEGYTFAVFLSLMPALQLFAQETETDFAALKTKVAEIDTKHFELGKEAWKGYKRHRVSKTSDYFKPNITTVSDSVLLTDSVYVKAYRLAALKKTKQRRTAGQLRLTGGIIAGVAVAAVVIAFISLFSGLNYQDYEKLNCNNFKFMKFLFLFVLLFTITFNCSHKLQKQILSL